MSFSWRFRYQSGFYAQDDGFLTENAGKTFVKGQELIDKGVRTYDVYLYTIKASHKAGRKIEKTQELISDAIRDFSEKKEEFLSLV